jgi:hypothetical protein
VTTTAVVTGHVTCVMDLPDGLATRAAAACAPMLPGGWCLHPAGDRGAVRRFPTLRVDVSDAPTVAVVGDTVHLHLTRDAAESATLAYATYTAAERARQQHRKLTLHANAAITPDGRGVLLLGHKGAGKTTTTLALGERGWTHAGDDLVVLAETDGELWLLPGKPTAAVRPSDPTLWQLPKPTVTLAPFTDRAVPLAAVVRLIAHPAVTHPVSVPAQPFSMTEYLRLHEALARYLSGLPTPLTGPGRIPFGTVWPLDTPALARWRTGLISRLERLPYRYLYAPDPQSAADLITKEML